MTNLLALQSGTDLVGDFRIERVLGAGGFGITYLAVEEALDRRVTIKEYFPSDYAARVDGATAMPRSQDCAGDYQWGLDRFIAEAQTLARFNHPNIVRVYRYFKANNTAYMVLHFEEGLSLKGWLKSLGRAPRQREIDELIGPLLEALEVVHKADFLHRDIAPDNIIIRKDGTPVLIDFGAARGEIAAHSKTVSALVKPGYSPYEQYAERSSQQGPWSDIYALGATLYHAVTGKRPPDSPSRMVKDEIVPAREAALAAYRQGFLAAIDKALALNVEARPQSVVAWRGDLLAPDPAKPGWLTRAKDKSKDRNKQAPAVAKAGGSLGAAVPPPPDAPGKEGGLLDFIDGLKQKPQAPAPGGVVGAAAATVPLAPAGPAAEVPSIDKVPHANGGDKARSPTSVARKAKPSRPRPVGSSVGWPRWRPLLVKLIIGAGVATAAVGLQDRLTPHIESRGAGVATSQSGEMGPVHIIKAHRGAAAFVAFTPDGRALVTAGQDATLKVWGAASGALTRTIELDNGAPTALAVHGRRALTGHGDGAIVLWDIDKAEKLASYKRGNDSVWSLAFIGEAGRFAAGTHNEDVAVWDAKPAPEPAVLLEGHDAATHALAVSPSGPYFASGSADRTVKLWNAQGQSLMRTYRGHKDFVTALAFAPEGKILASGALDGSIRLWSTSSSRLQRTLTGHKGRIGGLAFSPAGDLLASVGEDGLVRLWDFRRGRTARLMTGHSGVIRSVAYAPDGRRIATAGEDGTVRLWDAILPRRSKADRE
jgi:WD40 repeat protein/serine/threonine protein kinase